MAGHSKLRGPGAGGHGCGEGHSKLSGGGGAGTVRVNRGHGCRTIRVSSEISGGAGTAQACLRCTQQLT